MTNPDSLDPENAGEVEIVEGGELSNMFLVRVNGKTKPVKNTAKNKLLYKHGLYNFLYGGESDKKILSEEPYLAVKPLRGNDEYRIWNGNEEIGVTVQPSKVEKLLNGIVDIMEQNDSTRFCRLYRDILNNQVRRQVINPLSIIYPQSDVVPMDEGWVIRGLFKVTWEGDVHLVSKDLDEGDYVRGGNGVRKTDEPSEFFEFDEIDVEPKTITVSGNTYTLSELEMEFITKVEYLLEFESHLQDPSYIKVIKRHIRGEVNRADGEGAHSFEPV